MRKPDWGFESWYATLDTCNRTMIYASQLKKYLLSVSYNNWGDINRMLPGLHMEIVVETHKLSDRPLSLPVASPSYVGDLHQP